MERSTLITQLIRYIADSVLDGRDIGLDETTPLLEWGIINSLEIVRLLSFIQQRFKVDIPVDEIVPEYFLNIAGIADLILTLATSEQHIS